MREIRRLGRGEIDQHVREKRYVRKDGETVWGRVVVRPVVSADGAADRQPRDGRRHHRAQRALEELRLSEQRLRSVLDAAHEGIILQARDGTVLTFNKAAGAVFGVEETRGRRQVRPGTRLARPSTRTALRGRPTTTRP